MKKLIFPVLFALPCLASAKGYEIRQIDTAKRMAVVSVSGYEVRAGSSLIATAKDNTQCSLVVRNVIDNKAIVDTSTCSFALRAGQRVELSMLDSAPAAPAPQAHSSDPTYTPSYNSNYASFGSFAEIAPAAETNGVTIFALYDMADKLTGDRNAGGQSFGDTENSDTTFGVGVEYARYAFHFPGFYINTAYEFDRDISSEDVNGQHLVPNPKPTLTMFVAGGGANLLLTDNFYVKAGINYNYPFISGGNGLDTVKGRLGFEGGVGARFAGRFNAELIYRRLKMSASGKDFNIDNLTQSGFVLRGGYTF